MTTLSSASCVNCGRTEAQVPVIAWRYQRHELWVCVDCLPALIHERDKVLAKWRALVSTGQP